MLNSVKFRPTAPEPRLFRLRAAGLFALLASLLTACPPAPSAPEPTVQVTTPVSSVTFYPFQNGLSWRYLAPGDAVSAAPYVRTGGGAKLFGDTVAQTLSQSGRGTDITYFRTYNDTGVYLQGFTKPGVTIVVNPPWREYPGPGEWKSGLRWNGSSTLTVYGEGGKQTDQVKGDYTYTVLEQRDVSVNGTPYRVWVVNRQISGAAQSLFPPADEIWFVPFLGEVKTPEGLVLTGTNFRAGQR